MIGSGGGPVVRADLNSGNDRRGCEFSPVALGRQDDVLIDAPGPASSQVVLKGLRPTDALERILLGFPNQPNKAEGSNSKLLKSSLERDPVRALLRCQKPALHRLGSEQIRRFPLRFNLFPKLNWDDCRVGSPFSLDTNSIRGLAMRLFCSSEKAWRGFPSLCRLTGRVTRFYTPHLSLSRNSRSPLRYRFATNVLIAGR